MSAAVSSTGTLRPGDVVSARYRVERFLERHLHEESYAVRAVDDGRPLLLKLIVWPGGAPELTAAELQAWKHQASRLCHFRHPSLSQTHELVTVDAEGRTCLIREPVELEGQTLGEFLQALGRPLSESEVQLLAAQIGEALDAAHQVDLLHLCLSPRRILVLTDGTSWRVKLTDLALYPPPLAARFAEAGYLPPEVLSSQPCDARSDQFSLAVILYELLSGQPAFIGGPDEPREVVVQRVLAEDPLPLLLSQKVELALQRALSRSRGVRFPSMRDFVAALGGDVRSFSPQTMGQAKAIGKSTDNAWPRLWLPMAQGALWALCGLGLLLAARKLLFPPKPPRPPIQTPASNPPEVAQNHPGHGDSPDGSSDGELGQDLDEPIGRDLDEPTVPARLDAGTTRPAVPKRVVPRRPDGGAVVTRPIVTPPPTVTASAPVTTTVQVDISGQDGKLSAAQETGLRACVRQVQRPTVPYRVVLENITGTLYVSPHGTSDEFQTSSDFRDCLKLRISGIVVPKVVTISGKAKGKTTP